MSKVATIHKVTAARDAVEYIIVFSYRPGSPDYWNKYGGHWEQGWGPEIEFVSIEPDDAATHQELERWATDWLEENSEKCEEIAVEEHIANPD